MEEFRGDDFTATTTEWWDSSGEHHWGSPSPEEARDAFEMTIHYEYDDGTEAYTTIFSGDSPETAMGWDEVEYETDVIEYAEGTP